MTAPITGQAPPAKQPQAKAENLPSSPREEDAPLFQRALDRNRFPTARGKKDGPSKPTGQELPPLPVLDGSNIVTPLQPRAAPKEEKPAPQTAAHSIPLTPAATRSTPPPSAPAADLTQALVQLDSVLSPSARSDLHLPGDQWTVRHVTLENAQTGLSLGMNMGQGEQDQDALDDLIRRLRARGITARVTMEDDGSTA